MESRKQNVAAVKVQDSEEFLFVIIPAEVNLEEGIEEFAQVVNISILKPIEYIWKFEDMTHEQASEIRENIKLTKEKIEALINPNSSPQKES